jgi:phospholipase/carboxylesterase
VQIENKPIYIYENGWKVRIQPPKQPVEARVMLLIHGWTGDENVMWIFTRNLPDNYWFIAPRGPIAAGEGYAWLDHSASWPQLEKFSAAAAVLMKEFQQWIKKVGAPQIPFEVMGFSQGAAMAYALSAFFPQQINRIFGLAGFLPQDVEYPGRYTALCGKPVYIAHGTQDNIVPVELAEEAAQTLEDAGAQVTYCASQTGHKLSTSCLRGIEEFIRKPIV